MPHSTFNWVDVLVIILLIRAGFVGWTKGLTLEFFKFIGIVVTMFVSLRFYDNLSSWTQTRFLIPETYGDFIWFIILAATCILTIKLASIFLEKVVQLKFSASIEKPGGLSLGILRGILGTSLIIFAITLIHLEYLRTSVERSFLGYWLSRIPVELHSWFFKVF
ncbi:hypothetical protein B9J78_00905 [bacterium Unc6]|nr:hypothetical protein [bacterium Unc6]